ncbi:MAG: molybdopterin converting factor subunit 1 [Planctomycetota bacterium]|jgi:molybdopterin converting factor subunit 1
MRCEVLLFAQVADAIGTDRLTVELADGASVDDALAALSREHEALAAMRDSLAVAVNERYCAPATLLQDGDVIALIPPVSGG